MLWSHANCQSIQNGSTSSKNFPLGHNSNPVWELSATQETLFRIFTSFTESWGEWQQEGREGEFWVKSQNMGLPEFVTTGPNRPATHTESICTSKVFH